MIKDFWFGDLREEHVVVVSSSCVGRFSECVLGWESHSGSLSLRQIRVHDDSQ